MGDLRTARAGLGKFRPDLLFLSLLFAVCAGERWNAGVGLGCSGVDEMIGAAMAGLDFGCSVELY